MGAIGSGDGSGDGDGDGDGYGDSKDIEPHTAIEYAINMAKVMPGTNRNNILEAIRFLIDKVETLENQMVDSQKLTIPGTCGVRCDFAPPKA